MPAPELERVHALVGCHLVDERFDRKQVERVRNGTPVFEPDSVRNAAPLDDAVLDAVVILDIDARVKQSVTVADDAVPPAGDPAVVVECRFQALKVLRPEHRER